MAEYRFGDPGDLTLIRMTQPPATQVVAMRDWLNVRSRPGFWYWMARAKYDGPGELDVFLSDPDTALEFKMRWV